MSITSKGLPEKDTFEKTVRKLKADHDQVLSSLTREQEQWTAILAEEYEAKLNDLRNHADAKHSSMTELHESNLSSHKSTLEERVAALQAMLEHERKASEEKMVRLREEEEAKLESHKSILEERVAAMQTTLEHERRPRTRWSGLERRMLQN